MPEDIKTKMMLPFKPPITITNATQPGEEEGEVVPVPIHIIVDNAADFPCGGGGGGGGAKRVVLLPAFIGPIEGMCDESTEFMIVILKPGANEEDIICIALPSAIGESTLLLVEPDTDYIMRVCPNSGTLTFDSEIGVVARDIDNDVDLTGVCFPVDEDNNRYSVVNEDGYLFVEIEFSIPSSAGRVEFEFEGQK